MTETSKQIEGILATDSRMAAAAAEVLKNRGLSQKIVMQAWGPTSRLPVAQAVSMRRSDLMPEMIAQYAYDALSGTCFHRLLAVRPAGKKRGL